MEEFEDKLMQLIAETSATRDEIISVLELRIMALKEEEAAEKEED